jgi:hypothetical protein
MGFTAAVTCLFLIWFILLGMVISERKEEHKIPAICIAHIILIVFILIVKFCMWLFGIGIA